MWMMKRGKGHIERAEKGVIPRNKPIQAKDEKWKGRVLKMYDRGLLRQSNNFMANCGKGGTQDVLY